ncbi:MAG TPA: hypothetical protein VNE38_13820 [Ktedonobacteraceae bacterium]|nr:hypothetical protein [Ktedonobacteraceae bacterium]
MLATKQRAQVGTADLLRWADLVPILAPALAGCIMLIASLSPWLIDPLTGNLSAWRLPINIGWQFPAALNAVFNYGLLCLCCSITCFWVAWRARRGQMSRVRATALLCILPFVLFVLQYLCIDMQAMNSLAQHQLQWLLTNRYFGYSVTPLRIPVKLFATDATSIQGRFILLVQQISFGALLPCAGAFFLLLGRPRAGTGAVKPVSTPSWRRRLLFASAALFLLAMGRAPAALFCDQQAGNLLASGNYASALSWLNAAAFLNPSLTQVASYHIERGQAMYFLFADQSSDDSRAYLASTYNQQNDDLSAYQELFAAWQAHPGTPWIRDELSTSLAKLAAYRHPINGPPLLRPIDDDSALPWLEALIQVDPTSVFGRYAAGRIQYDLHNYSACIAQMNAVIGLSSNADILSTAYTYQALSAGGQQRFADERNLLFKAVGFDPDYHNNTAREALSGLH